MNSMRSTVSQAMRLCVRQWRLYGGAALMVAVVLGAAGGLSVIHRALNSPLPIPAPEQLYAFVPVDSAAREISVPAPLRSALKDAAPELGTVCSRNGAGAVQIDTPAGALLRRTELLGPGCLKTLGIDGSVQGIDAFDRSASTVGAPLAGFIGHQFWQSHFGGQPIVGRVLKVGGDPVEIVGVLPASFGGLDRDTVTDLILPGTFHATASGSATEFLVRIDPASAPRFDERVRAVWTSIAARESSLAVRESKIALRPVSAGFSTMGDTYGAALSVLNRLALATMAFGVLSLAGFLGLATLRRRAELRVRRALGASRAQLVMQIAIPALVAGVLGGVAAAAMSGVLARAMAAAVTTGRMSPLALPLNVTPLVAAAILLTAVWMVLIACVPSALIAARRTDRAENRAAFTYTPRSRARQVLLIAQVAVCLVFVSVAAIFGGTVIRLLAVPRGVDVDRVLFARATQVPGGYDRLDQRAYFPSVLRSLAAIPGVESASMTRTFPLTLISLTAVSVDNTAHSQAVEDVVSPEFFNTVGISRRAGRSFTDQDTVDTPPVAMISETMSRLLFPNGDPIGRVITTGQGAAASRAEIIGVVADATYGTMRAPERRVVYRASQQLPKVLRSPFYQLRLKGSPIGIEAAIKDVLTREGRERITGSQVLADYLSQSIMQERLLAAVGGAAAALALLLAAIGLYAMLASTVQAEARELAIRVALGATAERLQTDVLRRGAMIAALGISAGVPAAMMSMSTVRHFVPSIGALSTGSLAVGACASMAMAMAAAWLPARRASQVAAVDALRRGE